MSDHKKTSFALIFTKLLQEPLFVLWGFLLFILRKDLAAGVLAISIYAMVKPLMTILAYYWGSFSGRLRVNYFLANILCSVCFFVLPFYASIWFVVVAGLMYSLFYRAAKPAWMEILKLNLDKPKRGFAFSVASGLGYLEGVLLTIGVGSLLDEKHVWKWLFFIGAFLRVVSAFIVVKLPMREKQKISFKDLLFKPWKESLRLLRTRPDFTRFQWGFFLSGFGVVLLQPVLPFFFVDRLKISYAELAFALCICKGAGFALSSPIWGKLLDKSSISRVSKGVFLITGFFPLCLLGAEMHLAWLYAAYGLYGIGLAGSQLVWDMSGPVFAEKEDSAPYSSLNMIVVGVRGAMAASMGALLGVFAGPLLIFGVGSALSFMAVFALRKEKSLAKENL